jgi:peptide/nickel transport system substrate-binding protein
MKRELPLMPRAMTGFVVVIVLVGTVLGGLAHAQSAAPGKIVLHVGTTGDIVSPNPFKACCGSEYEMMFMNYDMLFGFKKSDLTFDPSAGLAESYKHSDDYMTWTFNIRPGINWSDGQPLTSKDIAFTYRFIVDNQMGAFDDYLPYGPTFDTPNDTTLIWHSTQPTFAPTVPPWIPILPEHIWSKFDGDKTAAKEFENVPAVGSGPFHLESWKQGQGWVMTANKDYWYGSPTIDEVDFQVFDNQEAMANALKSGQIDFAEALTPSLFNSLKGQPDIATHVAPPGYFDNFAFNFGSPQQPDDTHLPAVGDLAFRQAVSYAIDRQTIVSGILQGQGSVGTTITMPQSPWHYDPPADQQFTFDPEKAKEILDQAGYVDTNGDGIRNDPKTGDELILDTLTINSLTYSNDEGKVIQSNLKDVGIGVKLIPVSESRAYVVWGKGDYDAYIWDWGGDPDPDFILSIFTTHQCLSWSDGCYSNPQFDQMYDKQKTILTFADRKAYIDQMQQFIYDQVPEVVLVYEDDLQAYRTDRFTGYVPVPEPNGYLLFGWGPYSYINLKPVEASAGGTTSGATSGISTGVWLAIIAAVVVIGGGIFAVRRRKSEEDRA